MFSNLPPYIYIAMTAFVSLVMYYQAIITLQTNKKDAVMFFAFGIGSTFALLGKLVHLYLGKDSHWFSFTANVASLSGLIAVILLFSNPKKGKTGWRAYIHWELAVVATVVVTIIYLRIKL